MSQMPAVETETVLLHPLDQVEDMIVANEWPFERSSDDELVCEIAGNLANYRLFFAFQHDLLALYFSCVFDMRVPVARRPVVHELLSLVNEKMWVGHFELNSDDGCPLFRQTSLVRGMREMPIEQVEDLIDIALSECERFYPAFQYAVWGGRSPKEAMEAALIETVGEA